MKGSIAFIYRHASRKHDYFFIIGKGILLKTKYKTQYQRNICQCR